MAYTFFEGFTAMKHECASQQKCSRRLHAACAVLHERVRVVQTICIQDAATQYSASVSALQGKDVAKLLRKLHRACWAYHMHLKIRVATHTVQWLAMKA